jgi:hypothetical protein
MEDESIFEAIAGILEKYSPRRQNLLPLLLRSEGAHV